MIDSRVDAAGSAARGGLSIDLSTTATMTMTMTMNGPAHSTDYAAIPNTTNYTTTTIIIIIIMIGSAELSACDVCQRWRKQSRAIPIHA